MKPDRNLRQGDRKPEEPNAPAWLILAPIALIILAIGAAVVL